MLWILISLFFCWMLFREFKRRWVADAGFDEPDTSPVDKTYVSIMGACALLFAWPPFHYWNFERLLSRTASQLAAPRVAKVHCNTIVDTFIDSNVFAAGHANPETGDIVIQYPWCETLMDYLSHPERATETEIASLNLFTHESMHARGERDEAITECQAVQRNYRAARLLGVPDRIAGPSALFYYEVTYARKGAIGGMQAPYFSTECAPGKAMDERLPDSTWVASR